MKLINIKYPSEVVDLKTAVFNPIGIESGLYLPQAIETLDKLFINTLHNYSLPEIAELVLGHLLHEDLDHKILKKIVYDAFNFECPLVKFNSNISILELFHGPTLAFKDFGARFMSRLMAHLYEGKEEINIIVATSGDTGGAVANGFLGISNIKVHILYPKGKVSKLQEKQITTNGTNIHAIEVDGSFDDCQAIVKKCFQDKGLVNKNLTTANSINIARLLPQTIYYFEAYKQLKEKKTIFCVPSGNFGNITAGIIAQKMGLPIKLFIAGHNINDPIVKYVSNGKYVTQKAISTLSNAMDIGNPSNFPRAQVLYSSTWNLFKENIKAYSFTDKETINAIINFHNKTKYLLDPHTAIGYLAAEQYRKQYNDNTHICVLSTAHPCKFDDETKKHTNIQATIPQSILDLFNKREEKTSITNCYEQFKAYLLEK